MWFLHVKQAEWLVRLSTALADHKPVKPDFNSTHGVDRNGRNVEKCCAFWLEEFFTASQQNNVVLKQREMTWNVPMQLIQVPRSLEIINWFEKTIFLHFSAPKSSLKLISRGRSGCLRGRGEKTQSFYTSIVTRRRFTTVWGNFFMHWGLRELIS